MTLTNREVSLREFQAELGRAVWAWVRGRGGTTGSTAVARADLAQHKVFNGSVHPSLAQKKKKKKKKHSQPLKNDE